MCDTVVATAEVTANGVTLFGKNSDREPNEAQGVVYVPAADHPQGSRVKCTYIEIPQAPHTCAMLLSKPFWMWGAEMGTNEHGVTIGNEAVFTRVPYEKGAGLIGMDLLRLALERAITALEAVNVIAALLEEFGQAGNCGYMHTLHYHNSFLVADPKEAWVLETAGRHWAAKQITGVYTISNAITLGNDFDLASSDLVAYAVDRGWCKGKADFHFGRCYSDFLYTRFSASHYRQRRSSQLLDAPKGSLTVLSIMDVLRDHGHTNTSEMHSSGNTSRSERAYRPDKGIFGAEICKHASFGPVRGDNTNGSMVSNLQPDHPTHFITGTAAPCTSIYKPCWLDAHPDFGPQPSGVYDEATLFWQHERLHRMIIGDYQNRIKLLQKERDPLEARFIKGALEIANASASVRKEFADRCFAEAAAAEARWLEAQSYMKDSTRRGWLHRIAWDQFNKKAAMPHPHL